jgi:hypothetical protein
MIKKGLLILAAAVCMAFVPAGCEKPAPVPGPDEQEQPDDKPQEEVKLEALKGEIDIIDDMIFDENPEFTLKINNPNPVAVKAEVKLTLTTDKGASLESRIDSVEVAPSGVTEIQLS